MNVLIEDFLHRFPEFKPLTKDYIEVVLEEAREEIDGEVWGKHYRAGVLFLAADKIALSPVGEPARLQLIMASLPTDANSNGSVKSYLRGSS